MGRRSQAQFGHWFALGCKQGPSPFAGCSHVPVVTDSTGLRVGVVCACSLHNTHFFTVFVPGFRRNDYGTERLRQRRVYRSV